MCKKMAEFFAYELYSSWSFVDKGPEFEKDNRTVFMAIVPKDKIMVYDSNLLEYECILEPCPENYIELITQPT